MVHEAYFRLDVNLANASLVAVLSPACPLKFAIETPKLDHLSSGSAPINLKDYGPAHFAIREPHRFL